VLLRNIIGVYMLAAAGALAAAILPSIIAYFSSNKENALANAGKAAAIGIPAGGALYESLTSNGQGGAFSGTPGQVQQTPNFNPQQQAFLSQLLGNIGSVTPQTGRGPGFEPIAENEVRRFHEQTIPSIAERFTSLGSGGSQRSSAFQGALGQAAGGLSSELASMGAQFGQRQQALDQNQLNSLLQLALMPQFSQQYISGQPGILHGVSGGLSQGIGQSIGRQLFPGQQF
jgi:hypothetical protein